MKYTSIKGRTKYRAGKLIRDLDSITAPYTSYKYEANDYYFIIV